MKYKKWLKITFRNTASRQNDSEHAECLVCCIIAASCRQLLTIDYWQDSITHTRIVLYDLTKHPWLVSSWPLTAHVAQSLHHERGSNGSRGYHRQGCRSRARITLHCISKLLTERTTMHGASQALPPAYLPRRTRLVLVTAVVYRTGRNQNHAAKKLARVRWCGDAAAVATRRHWVHMTTLRYPRNRKHIKRIATLLVGRATAMIW